MTTKTSRNWIGQHWLGVTVIAGTAAVSGWWLRWQPDEGVSAVAERITSTHESTINHLQRISLSPDSPGEAGFRTQNEFASHTQAANKPPARITAESLTDMMVTGTDSERHGALVKALQQDIELPPDVLVHAYVNDPSDAVRLLAFTTYIDSISDDVEVVQAALKSATNNTSPIVQAEAFRRLEEFASYEAALAAAPAQRVP